MSVDHRYLWSTSFVVQHLRTSGLSEAATFTYFLAIMTFDWLQFTAIASTPTPTISAPSFANSWFTFGITVVGLVYLYVRNGRGQGRQFLQRYFALSVTVGWKFVAAMLAVMWLIEAALVGSSPEFRGWSSTGALAALNLAMFWRIGEHLASLARERDAYPFVAPDMRVNSNVGCHNRTVMNIRIATTDSEITACYPVMRELRPHIAEDHFLPRVRSQEQTGYRLAVVEQSDAVVAVAGFRVGENLAWGRFLYVDDLVTVPSHRSKGFGASLLNWLREFAVNEGCVQMHLDSGIQRKDTHRFYAREGMSMASAHFVEHIAPQGAPEGRAQAARP